MYIYKIPFSSNTYAKHLFFKTNMKSNVPIVSEISLYLYHFKEPWIPQIKDWPHMMKSSPIYLHSTVVDLAFGFLAPSLTTSHAKNFTSKSSPILGQATIGKGQPEAILSLGNDMSTTSGPPFDIATQSLSKAEASGNNKAGASIDPDAHLRCAIEALKVRWLNKQQVLVVVVKTVNDTFIAQDESILNQGVNKENGCFT
ncbi:hypothetical protein CsSME_00005561 [Camellia sinensis var. sinensis]